MKIQFNLLPQKQKKHLKIQKMFRIIMEEEIQILIICLIAFVSIFGMYFVLNSEVEIMNNVKEKITEREEYKELIEIHKTFKKVRGEMSVFSKLTDEHIRWSQLLIILSDIVPDSITVDSLKTNDNKVSMKAVADTREDVIEFKTALKEFKQGEVPCFTKVSVPESELTVPIDVRFGITFEVDVTCLK